MNVYLKCSGVNVLYLKSPQKLLLSSKWSEVKSKHYPLKLSGVEVNRKLRELVSWENHVDLSYQVLYLNFIMNWPSLLHSCMFLISLGFSSSWRGKTKKNPVR